MNQFEDELRHALRRQNAPAGFAGRVMARIEADARPAVGRRFAIAAGLVLMLAAGSYQVDRERRQRAEANEVRAELALALQITAQKIDHTKALLRDVTENR